MNIRKLFSTLLQLEPKYENDILRIIQENPEYLKIKSRFTFCAGCDR